MLERTIFKKLWTWLTSPKRKPLILKGARQVGKSFAIKEFAQRENKNIHIINFQANKQAHTIFQWNLLPQELILKIEYLLDKPIDIDKDILFFDEIQECPEALNSFKFFCEDMPQLALIGAGSYIGIMSSFPSFPVGKVTYLSMYPLTYQEFLWAIDPKLFTIYKNITITTLQTIDAFFHQKLLQVYYLYLVIWWMPEIVQAYIDWGNKPDIQNLQNTRKLQQHLIESYKADFAKHAWTTNATHILHVYDAAFSQLSQSFDQEVDKFKVSHVIPWQKWYSRIAWPLQWLIQSRLLIKNYLLKDIQPPLSWNKKTNTFKIFVHDVGLLNAYLNTPITWLLKNQQLGTYKGYIVENFVATELFAIDQQELYCFHKAQTEIEFLLQHNKAVIPLEVKSSTKTRKAKSLHSFIKKYHPPLAYKITAQNYGKHDLWYETIPLYLVGKLFHYLSKV